MFYNNNNTQKKTNRRVVLGVATEDKKLIDTHYKNIRHNYRQISAIAIIIIISSSSSLSLVGRCHKIWSQENVELVAQILAAKCLQVNLLSNTS